ncbi:hypothetical protein LZ30DRAFT_45118 [Colletotrichum cereale]|nr:hypothetical protein LZ30DRAFT_45118 [Colletotrichum cereale]
MTGNGKEAPRTESRLDRRSCRLFDSDVHRSNHERISFDSDTMGFFLIYHIVSQLDSVISPIEGELKNLQVAMTRLQKDIGSNKNDLEFARKESLKRRGGLIYANWRLKFRQQALQHLKYKRSRKMQGARQISFGQSFTLLGTTC